LYPCAVSSVVEGSKNVAPRLSGPPERVLQTTSKSVASDTINSPRLRNLVANHVPDGQIGNGAGHWKTVSTGKGGFALGHGDILQITRIQSPATTITNNVITKEANFAEFIGNKRAISTSFLFF
jgi:hypothetical protein